MKDVFNAILSDPKTQKVWAAFQPAAAILRDMFARGLTDQAMQTAEDFLGEKRADAIATVEELDKSPLPPADAEPAVVIEYWKNQAQLARKSLINIGGTAEHYYDDGFLGPVYRWLTATKPQWIKEAD